ncbi:MAG: isoaspartyl peptidase/L-asparaginase [Lactimicrobium sp.]|uniref:isoaspartyl peptidase/L-asparaginase n=1 Tax=Lactimicrobium sp. TaxID=2563780 RepID=UPI002F3519BD
MIGTWEMAAQGADKAADILARGGTAKQATLTGVQDVEDNPEFHSVGYGGLPGKDGHIAMDAGYMDGDTLHFGAVSALEGFRSPAAVAQSLAQGDANNFRTGAGAALYAEEHGFEKRNNLTPEAQEIFEKKQVEKLKAYDGHDTVCFLVLDQKGTICATTSTSGLFMKEPGRVGDTPMPGVGYYADSEVGGAAATGMGEEIAKGALSYAVVAALKAGVPVQSAAEHAVKELNDSLIRRNGYAQPMSLIAIDNHGNWGVGTNCEFTFAVADDEHAMRVYEVLPQEAGLEIRQK